MRRFASDGYSREKGTVAQGGKVAVQPAGIAFILPLPCEHLDSAGEGGRAGGFPEGREGTRDAGAPPCSISLPHEAEHQLVIGTAGPANRGSIICVSTRAGVQMLALRPH